MQAGGANAQLEGNPLDAAIFGLLLLIGIGVLVRRSKRALPLIAANWPTLIYFVFCFISVAWSYHPDVAMKRWIKAISDPVMCLVILTDPQPIAAIRRVMARVGFVLLPASVLLIKYYGNLGRGYTPDGQQMNTGVTTFKNELGVTVLVVSLCTFWTLINLWKTKKQPSRTRRLVAQGTLLAFGAWLLVIADSKTSVACFILACLLVLAGDLRIIRLRPSRVHVMCLLILLAGGLTLLFGGESGVAHVAQAMGRDSTLSGRTDIWSAALAAAPNALIGAGFESFWISPNAHIFAHILAVKNWWHPELLNEAHDGYIEVYLNLGLVGVGLISLILVHGYMRAAAAFKRNPAVGGLMLAFIMTAAFYNITEAGFRMLFLMWTFLLLAVFSATGVATGILRNETPSVSSNPGRAVKRKRVSTGLMPDEAASPIVQ